MKLFKQLGIILLFLIASSIYCMQSRAMTVSCDTTASEIKKLIAQEENISPTAIRLMLLNDESDKKIEWHDNQELRNAYYQPYVNKMTSPIQYLMCKFNHKRVKQIKIGTIISR